MFTIYLPIDMDREASGEAKRLLIHTIEKINQKRGYLGDPQKGHLNFLTRQFNEGNINIEGLNQALEYVVQEALTMAKSNLPKTKQ